MWDIISGGHQMMCLGNYSFEVLERALTERNVSLSWIKREVFQSAGSEKNYVPEAWRSSSLIGFILNEEIIDSNIVKRIILPKNRRHWVAITRFNMEEDFETDACLFRILDSRHAECMEFRSWTEVRDFVRRRLEGGSQVLAAHDAS
jgi:hypothetical protein